MIRVVYIISFVILLLLNSCGEDTSATVINSPEIIGISKTTTFYGDEMTIYGKYFGEAKSNSSIHFITEAQNDTIIWIGSEDCQSWSSTAITFKIIEKLQTAEVEVCVGGLTSNRFYLNIKVLPDFDMLSISKGSFSMGSEFGFDNEKPINQITLTNDFLIGKHEVSQQLWKSVMKNNPSIYIDNRLPIHNVPWIDAIKFCNQLSNKAGLDTAYTFLNDTTIECNPVSSGYRLPTEAEWEYACKSGTNDDFPGNDNPTEIAWYSEVSGYMPHTVGTKATNPNGLYDMHGNVWEWCWDFYLDDYYTNMPSENPTGPDIGERRVLRGGSVASGKSLIRSSNRTFNEKNYENCGLRLVRTIK